MSRSDAEKCCAEATRIVAEIESILRGRDARAIMVALTEMHGRVLSHCVHNEQEMEKAIGHLVANVRGWWLADRGGPFRPQ